MFCCFLKKCLPRVYKIKGNDVKGAFKKRPNFCYKDFTTHFTEI